MPEVLPLCKAVMFADYVVIFASRADLSILFHNLSNTILSSGDWCDRNHLKDEYSSLLSLNEKKCQYMLFFFIWFSENRTVFSFSE